MLNCKIGDLAVVVRNVCPENMGKIVRIVAKMPAGRTERVWESGAIVTLYEEDWWQVDVALVCRNKISGARDRFPLARDRHLRPLRELPGDDETLAWAGKPDKTPQRL